jgi:two-component system phosphate regulon sensor histidine kinase PhoR
MFRTIRWRIAVPYVVLILLIMLGLSTYLSNMVRQAHLADLESKLTDEAQLVGDALGSQLARGTPNEVLDSLVLHYADLLGARVTIIAADGTVLGESHEERTQMDNHLYRPEVQEALATG